MLPIRNIAGNPQSDGRYVCYIYTKGMLPEYKRVSCTITRKRQTTSQQKKLDIWVSFTKESLEIANKPKCPTSLEKN